MTQDEIKADLVKRVGNAVTDLRHEWANAGADVAIEFDVTATGVTVSIVAKVAPVTSKSPLGKKRLGDNE